MCLQLGVEHTPTFKASRARLAVLAAAMPGCALCACQASAAAAFALAQEAHLSPSLPPRPQCAQVFYQGKDVYTYKADIYIRDLLEPFVQKFKADLLAREAGAAEVAKPAVAAAAEGGAEL